MTGRERQFARLTAAARSFALVALAASILWARDTSGLLALGAIALIWAAAQLAQTQPRLSLTVLGTTEAALVGAVCGLSLDASLAVLAALVVPPFAAGVLRGLRGVALALSAQLTALVLVAFTISGGLTSAQGLAAFTWSATGLGLGLIASFLHSSLRQVPDPLAPYRNAQSLIRELIGLSGGLSSGLDPVPLGGVILSAVRDELPAAVLTLYVPRGETLTPLITKTSSSSSTDETIEFDDLAVEAWALGRPVIAAHAFAFPLVTQAGITAVVGGLLSDRLDPGVLGLEDRIRHLGNLLGPSSVHLDTALLFAAFRDAATAEERRRLAREMHDGVAQDIASLGYLVDALGARPASPEQAEQIEVLRERITAVVAEVRRSVVTLRTSVGSAESLGTAIGAIARNLTEVSGVPIQVTLDERTTRLRSEVEAELFRIAQEAMTNAVRHARATSIDVHCQVHAPGALITVTDNGQGLQEARPDSHGLDIMRERATLIGATLEIKAGPTGGTIVSVCTPERVGSGSPESKSPNAMLGA